MLNVSSWSPAEIVERAVSGDEREWVPSATDGVHRRILPGALGIVTGGLGSRANAVAVL